MTRTSTSMRRKRPARTAVLVAVVAAALVILALPGSAIGLIRDAIAPPPASPTSADQIQNIDQVKTAIKALLRRHDRSARALDPVDGATTLHTFSPTGAYADEMAGIVDATPSEYLDEAAGNPTGALSRRQVGDPARHRRHDAEHLQLRDLQQLRLQPDEQRSFRQRRRSSRPCRGMVDLEHVRRVAMATRSSSSPAGPETAAGRARSRTCRTRATTSTARQRLPEGPCDGHRGCEPCAPSLHHDAVQVADPAAHRVARLRHRRPTSVTSSAI